MHNCGVDVRHAAPHPPERGVLVLYAAVVRVVGSEGELPADGGHPGTLRPPFADGGRSGVVWSDHMPAVAATTSAPRAWEGVLRRIEADLLSGTLVPGDRLPGERELASTLGVGRSSVREALRVLEAMGLVRTAVGSGPSAGAFVVAAPGAGLAQLLRLQVASRAFPVADVVAYRLLLEEWGVSAAAERSAVIDDAAQLLIAMDDTALSRNEFLALDAQFHIALARASGNAVVEASMAGLRSAVEEYVTSGAEALGSHWDAMRDTLHAEHTAIMAAISGGNPELARTLVGAHIIDYHAATDTASRNEKGTHRG